MSLITDILKVLTWIENYKQNILYIFVINFLQVYPSALELLGALRLEYKEQDVWYETQKSTDLNHTPGVV